MFNNFAFMHLHTQANKKRIIVDNITRYINNVDSLYKNNIFLTPQMIKQKGKLYDLVCQYGVLMSQNLKANHSLHIAVATQRIVNHVQKMRATYKNRVFYIKNLQIKKHNEVKRQQIQNTNTQIKHRIANVPPRQPQKTSTVNNLGAKSTIKPKNTKGKLPVKVNNSQISNLFMDANDDVLDAHDDILDANDELLDANDGVLDANDDILDANDDILDANDDILYANDDILEANDEILYANDDILDANDELLEANDELLDANEDELLPAIEPEIVTVNNNELLQTTTCNLEIAYSPYQIWIKKIESQRLFLRK